eukprot:4030825-Amphidinium_carterae.1
MGNAKEVRWSGCEAKSDELFFERFLERASDADDAVRLAALDGAEAWHAPNAQSGAVVTIRCVPSRRSC